MSPKKQKLMTILCVMIGTTISAIAYASGTQHIAYPIISRIWNMFINLAFTSGLILMATSIIALVMALKDEDAEAKAKAIRAIAIAVGLLSFQLLLDPVLGALGFFR